MDRQETAGLLIPAKGYRTRRVLDTAEVFTRVPTQSVGNTHIGECGRVHVQAKLEPEG